MKFLMLCFKYARQYVTIRFLVIEWNLLADKRIIFSIFSSSSPILQGRAQFPLFSLNYLYFHLCVTGLLRVLIISGSEALDLFTLAVMDWKSNYHLLTGL